MAMITTFDEQLLELIEDFKLREEEPIRTARRPAGEQVLIETWTLPEGKSEYASLLDFWLSSLYGFLEDSGSDVRWFEGLAYQSRFVRLECEEFRTEYRALQQRLTLPPLETVFLTTAYRVLDGRLISYMGVNEDGDFWSATYGPGHYHH